MSSSRSSSHVVVVVQDQRSLRELDATCGGCGSRWREERRRASLAWWDRPRDLPPPPPSGMTFGSATWVEILELVHELTMMVRHYRVPPGPEELARVAADIRAGAADREGPMPIEVRRFLAEYEDGAESRG